jgi:hypothetical protein
MIFAEYSYVISDSYTRKLTVTDRHKTYYILLHISLGEARSAYIGQQKVRMLEFLSTNLN